MADAARLLWDVVEPYVSAEGVELDDVEVLGGGKIVRVVVDSDQSLGVDRIADLSRGISRLIDEDDPFTGSYTLEVTSPGLERKLRRPEHFHKALGREVTVKTHSLINDEKNHRGTLVTAEDDAFVMEIDGSERRIEFQDVASARTVFVWEKGSKPGKNA
ncbi:MAG: ribosome maturation factor RimP [Actinomycetota bacterium]|nr:ribosome maturation factor RimP [Actinomycetota bacterium]